MNAEQALGNLEDIRNRLCGCDDCDECNTVFYAMNFIKEYKVLWPPTKGNR